MAKNLIIALLACSTSAFAVVAFWRQARPSTSPPVIATDAAAKAPEQARETRATESPGEPAIAMLTPDAEEAAAMRRENARLQQLVRDLQSEVSILNARRMPAPSMNPDRPSLPQLPQQLLVSLLGNPETVGMAMDWIKADQAQRYASLIALTNLDEDARGELRDILAERYATRLDMAAVGLESVTSEQRLQLDGEFRTRLENLVGSGMTAMLEKAEGKPISFARMQRLDEQFRYEATALTADQYLPLWNLVSAEVQYASGPVAPEALMQRRIDSTEHIIDGAREFLAPDQLAVLASTFDRDIAMARVQTYSMLQAMRQREQAQREESGSSPP